jgi:hypothetical protein
MDLLGAPSLFHAFAAMLLLGAGYVALQRKVTTMAPVEEQVPFAAAAPDMAPTSFDLDPRGPENAEGELAPAEELPSLDELDASPESSNELEDRA